jgi:hypothetical protein
MIIRPVSIDQLASEFDLAAERDAMSWMIAVRSDANRYPQAVVYSLAAKEY